jgi:hypothetical protein
MLLAAASPPPELTLVVSAGPTPRRNTILSLQSDRLRPGTTYTLRADPHPALALQVDADGRAWLVLPELPAGATRIYRVEETTAPARGRASSRRDAGRHDAGAPSGSSGTRAARADAGGLEAIADGDNVRLLAGGRERIVYVGGAGRLPNADIEPIFRRGGYLHPVRTPSSRIVTGDYPADHRHHHGIWFAWTRTRFEGREPDFWNMGQGKGRVESVALERRWNGAVHAGLRARHRYVDSTSGSPVAVLSEVWETRLYATPAGAYVIFDVDVEQTNVTASPLELPEYHYGGIGVRGADAFTAADNVIFLTSEGHDRHSGDATRARWAAFVGTVDGERAGLAVLGHPSNFRTPEPLRIHPTDPYLCFAPSRLGAWAIAAGATHRARYRFVAFDGAIDRAELDRLWTDYASPPTAAIR